eukprot:12899419-Prorocentrum_lima.AAC.1
MLPTAPLACRGGGHRCRAGCISQHGRAHLKRGTGVSPLGSREGKDQLGNQGAGEGGHAPHVLYNEGDN